MHTAKDLCSPRKKLKLGLALGSGSAKGLAHIGVLKTLHQHKIYPDYLAGTSMGAVIGAAYAAGHSPLEIEKLFQETDWKNMVDFASPKAGLIQGKRAENRIRQLLHNKTFSQLEIPLRLVAYDLTAKKKVIFSQGNVARAVRASISMPGIFAPVKIGHHYYIDGGVVDPTPFEVLKEMGADVIIAVDLYGETKTVAGPVVQEKTLMEEWRQKFIVAELLNVKKLLFPDYWPQFIRKVSIWIFDKILYPARLLRILAGKEPPLITKIMYETLHILLNNLAREKLKHAPVDFKITPIFDRLGWMDFDKLEQFVKIGEEAMKKQIPTLKKKLGQS